MRLEGLVLQITTHCPHHCPQCYMQRGQEDLALDVAKKYIDWACENGARAVQLTGGEPLVYPDLRELLAYVRSKQMYSLLATSGWNHSWETYTALKESGLSLLCVSVNDILESHNDTTRDDYAESLVAIQDACECGLLCCCNVVVTDDNIERLDLMGEYFKAKGVRGISLLRPVRSYDGSYIPSLSPKTLETLHAIVSKDTDFWRVENCFGEYWTYVSGKPFSCRDIGEYALFINVDGTVSPCSKTTGFRYDSVDSMMKDIDAWKIGCAATD